MPKSIHITAPRPTREQMQAHLRISKARQKELHFLLLEAKAKLGINTVTPPSSNGSEKRRKRASAA